MVKNLPSNAGDAGSIPGQGNKIPHAAGQPSPCATTTELACLMYRAHELWISCATTREEKTRTLQLETSPCAAVSGATKILHATTKT